MSSYPAMATLSCPACKTALKQAGYTEKCATCDGAWVAEDVLVAILQERASAMVDLPWQSRAQNRDRGCAVCGTPMQAVSLGGVPLDRCPSHGVWFDEAELAGTIAHAKEFKNLLGG